MNVFEAVKQFVTTREVAEFYGFSVNRAGMIACPFHNDRTPSMKVDKRFHCFGCGADGDAVDFIARLFGKGTKEAAEMIATDFALAYDRNGKPPVLPKAREPTAEQKFEAEEKRCFRVLSDYFHKLRAWETDYAPKQPEDEWHPLFTEALQRKSYIEYTDCWIKMCESSCNPLSIALVVLDSAILFTLPVGGWLYLRDSLSAASYLLFILLTMCFFTSFLNMVTIAMQSMELGSGLDNVKKIMDMETMKSGQQTLSKTGCYGIDFDNVTFNYTQGGKDALSDVDIHLEPGSLNAFVGPSGAGKTTAVQLLGRYWDVSSGTIKIGGVPVTELQTENLSDLTAFVFQDVFLLEDTLLENIRMGTDATEEQVRQAAKAAQIDDFIMSLPKGYATRIGDEGVKLSGGQQQRISIARAILKDAPIVVFDEATSYSDIENEHKIQLALQNLLRGKTTIMIAHRLHTIRNADKIFVFQDGKVVEQGTHDELIASGSTYSHMWDTYTRETIGEE